MNTTDTTARIADMQSRGLENAVAFGRVATGVFERLARQNYAVMGDVVDYTLAQMRIPTQHTDPRAALEAQVAGTRGLAEKARVRADEYAAIAGEMRELAGSAMKVGAVRVAKAKPAAPVVTSTPAAAAPKFDAPKADAPKAEADEPKADAPKADASKAEADASKVDAPKANASKADKSAAAPQAKETGGTPIILPSDSPKAAVRKTVAATAPKAATANKPAAKKPVAKKGAAKAAKAAPTKPEAKTGTKRPATKASARRTKG